MTTQTVTAASLHAEYAGRLATAVGLSAADYQPTYTGLAGLLRDVAGRLSPVDQNREWLGEAAANLSAAARLDGEGRVTQRLLQTAANTLYEAVGELEIG